MQAPLLARVCGSVRPAAIISTQNVIYVRFRSDVSGNHRGFSARFIEGVCSPASFAFECFGVKLI